MPASELLNGLEGVMREAGDLARTTASRRFRHWTKGEARSPVSEADIAVNDLLRERLARLVPEAGWLSEETEDDPAARSAAQVWVVDPIDGTRAFIAGRPDWTVSVALVADGRPVVAALYAPVTEQMFLAEHGAGASLNGAPMRVSAGGALTGARVAGPKKYLDRLETLEPAILPQPKVHSLALRLTRVGSGELDAAFSSGGSHDWDLAAAHLLVHEAGGFMTDFFGRPLTFNGVDVVHGGVLAAAPARHGALLELVRDRMPEFA